MAHFLKKEREIKSLKPKESLIKVKNECRGIFFENTHFSVSSSAATAAAASILAVGRRIEGASSGTSSGTLRGLQLLQIEQRRQLLFFNLFLKRMLKIMFLCNFDRQLISDTSTAVIGRQLASGIDHSFTK